MQYKFPKKTITATGLIHTGPADFGGFFIGGLNGTNDEVLTIFDGIDGTGSDYILPPTTINGATNDVAGWSFSFIALAHTGIHVTITGVGTIKVTLYYKGR